MRLFRKKEFVNDEWVKAAATQARIASTNEELADICRKMNVADQICLGKMDLWLAKHALSAVYKTLKEYPKLRNLINYFGTLDGYIVLRDRALAHVERKGDRFLRDVLIQTTGNIIASSRAAFSSNGLALAFYSGSVEESIFSGILINENNLNHLSVLNNLEYAEKSGFNPNGCKSVRSVMDHEIGHLFDYMLGINRCSEYKRFLRSYTPDYIGKNLSQYSVMNPAVSEREIIAEGYSEYRNNPTPRPIATFIGDLIVQKYKRYAK